MSFLDKLKQKSQDAVEIAGSVITKSATTVAEAAQQIIKTVPQDMQKRRFDICLECPELIQLTAQCKKCGCLMKIKTALESAQCPLGKW